MYKRKITIIFLAAFTFLMIFFRSNLFAIDNRASDNELFLRNRLINTIDSIDIEKQLRKRSGQNIEEMEIVQKVYIDSLAALRSSMQTALTKQASSVNNVSILQFFNIDPLIHPKSFFDWLILATSSIAVLSFLVLIIVIIRAAQKKRPLRKNTARLSESKQSILPDIHHVKTQSSGGTSIVNEISKPSMDSLNQIRQKIQNASDYYEKAEPRPSTQILKAQLSSIQKQRPDIDLETQVYDSYRKGMDIHEISRKFLLSEDHVSLLLKIKGIALKKPDTSK